MSSSEGFGGLSNFEIKDRIRELTQQDSETVDVERELDALRVELVNRLRAEDLRRSD